MNDVTRLQANGFPLSAQPAFGGDQTLPFLAGAGDLTGLFSLPGMSGLDSFLGAGNPFSGGGGSGFMTADTQNLLGFIQTGIGGVTSQINEVMTGIQNGTISGQAPPGEGGGTAGAPPTGGTESGSGTTVTGSGTEGSGAASATNAQFDKNWDSELGAIPQSDREAFKSKVLRIAQNLQMDPDHLMAIMKSESGIDPTAVNGDSGATGLIQFMPDTASGLGTSTSTLKNMSAVDQLDYVERYLNPYKGKLNTPADAYMAVFSPAFIGKGDNHVAYSRSDGAAYSQNAGLDANGDGQITNGELGQRVERYL